MAGFTHHIFICGNARSAGHARGSCDPESRGALREAFKRELKRVGLTGSAARANQAGCLDQCEFGPTVVIYPRGVWYGRVRPEDVPRIVERTLLGGEILEDLAIPEECLNCAACPGRKCASPNPRGAARR